MANGRKGDYAVGYGRPPVHTRFRKGASGNPAGRPRGSRSLGALLAAEFDKPVAVREGGSLRRMRKREALAAALVNRALQGEARATALLVGLLGRAEPDSPPPAAPTSRGEDQEIIDAFLARMREADGADGG